MAQPMGFTIVIRGSGQFPAGQFPAGPFGGAPENGGALEPLIEVHEDEGEILVLAELPGVSGDQVKFDLEEGALRIAASDGDRRFTGRAELPPVDPGSLTASCRNGVLEVRFRRIPETPE
jgi:HSP20 family molecular chaperone IbpA